MEVGRNDLCPCGSGKKYKKCCMKKSEIVEMKHVKRERFFQLKYQLVQALVQEVFGPFSPQDFQRLENQFEDRVEGEVPDTFIQHWVLFFKRDEHGLRGIERFNRSNSILRDPLIKQLANEWENMTPRLIQQVDYDEQGVFVEDLFTKERFHMPYCETMPEWIPWAGTLCMLEEFDGGYYINGVATSVDPISVQRAYDFIEEKMKATGMDFQQTAFEFYPEIHKTMLSKPNLTENTTEVTRTELHYTVDSIDPVLQALQDDERFFMDDWKNNSGQGSFLRNIHRYIDNCAPGPVRIAEAVGSVDVKGKKLTFSTMSNEEALSFKNKLSGLAGVQLVEDKSDRLMVSQDVKIALYSIMLPNDVPQSFIDIAQEAMILEETLGQPLPMFDGLSPEQMAAAGNVDELEQWLRQREFHSNRNMKERFGQVSITADYNSVRRKLGLELSPFVTLREERKSRLVEEVPVEVSEEPVAVADAPAQVKSSVPKEDLELMEEIGIPFEEAEQFYVKDILECFREKGVGKSQSTYYKYRLGLQTIGYFLSQKIVYSWNDVNEDDWRKWLTFNYLAFNMDATINQVKGFMSVFKNFIDKIDETYGTKHAPVVKKLIKEIEPSIQAAVKVMDSYASYQERRNEPEYEMDPLFDTIFDGAKISGDTINGLFEVVEVKEKGVSMKLIGSSGSEAYTTAVDSKHLEHIKSGMVIFGELQQQNQWQLTKIYRTFPAQAVQYIGELVAH